MFNTELAFEQLKARAGIFISSNAEFKSKELTIGINSVIVVIGLRVFGNTTYSISPNRSVFGIPSIPNTGQYLGLMESQKLE